MSDPVLSYQTLNPFAPTTTLFIHGAFSSHREWIAVATHLPTYHLLIPSLPSHGSNQAIRPFSVPLAAHLLANLVHDNAKNGRAHVVGLSLGGHVAVYFAARYPEVVGTVFASGINMFVPSVWTPVLPYVLFCTQNLIQVVWRPLVNYLLDITIPRGGHDESTPCRLPLCREVIAALVSDEEIAPATARTLVIAATKRGFLPTNDSVASAKRVGEIMKRGNSESKVVEAPTMRHAWDLQDPQTFARCIEAWIEGKELPDVFTEL